MTKACMVVSVWFGPRRPDFNSPTTPKVQQRFVETVFMEHARRVDPGVDMDLIIVNNIGTWPKHHNPKDWACEIPEKAYHRSEIDAEIIMNSKPHHRRLKIDSDVEALTPGQHKGNEYIASLDNTEINRGNVRVFRRRNTPGKGFDGFAFGFMKTQDDYDYFLFCEDDVVFFLDDYFKEGIETFESNKHKIGCVGYSLISPTHAKPHFAGGLLMSSKENLARVANSWPEFLRYHEYHNHSVNLWDLVTQSTDTGLTPALNWKNWPSPRLPDNENDFTHAFNFISPNFRPKNKHTLSEWPMMYPEALSPFARNWKVLSFQADTLKKVKKLLHEGQYANKHPIYFTRLQKKAMETMIEKASDQKCFFVGNENEGCI